MDDGDGDGEDRQHHPAIEVSLTHSMEQLRHIAYEATPRPEDLFTEQRALLRTATARIARKGLSTDTETYRRLGILVPHWKHPAQFEAVLYELRDYWKHHNSAISLGRSYPFRKVREKAGNYLRKMARRAQGEEDSDDDDFIDNEDDDDNEDRDDPNSCKLPSATMVRVFRLVNGNLEIPPTLFKALAMAGRIKDAFFPDEPSTWEQGRGGRGLGGMDDDNSDASTEASFNGTQTDPDSSSSSDDDDDDDDDDDNVMEIERDEFEERAPPQVDNQVRQAAVQFFQQMQVARPRDANNNNNNGRGNGGGGSGGGPFGGMNLDALPEVIRRMFGFGSNPAPAPQMPMMPMPAAQPNLVFCPMPIMVMPMAMGQAGMGQAGMGDMMMNAMQNMMDQMAGANGSPNTSGSGSGSWSNIFGGGSSARPARSKLLLQPSVKDEDDGDDASNSSLFMSRYGSGSTSSRTTSGSKRTHSSTADSTTSSDSRKKAKTASSSSSTSSSSSSSAIASSSRTPLPSSSRSASRSALNVVNASGKRKETFSEYQQRRARHVEKKRHKASKK